MSSTADLVNLTPAEMRALDRSALVGTLGAGITHAFNNTLAALMGQIELMLLELDPLSDDIKLKSLLQSCQTASDMLRGFQDSIKGMEIAVPVEAGRIIKALAASLERIHRRDNISIEIESAPSSAVQAGGEFCQSLFHLLRYSCETLQSSGASSRVIKIAGSNDKAFGLHVSLSTEPVLPALPSGYMPGEARFGEPAFHLRMASLIADDLGRRGLRAGWSQSPNGRLTLDWPLL
ncbi:MAG: hypothetical protein FJY67_06485 [Calditrichaeota bacterium]|nr:hypothetical protein [Calditrichota bacterium]